MTAENIESLVKCAELYAEQGLYLEAKEKYGEVLSHLSRQSGPAGSEKLRAEVEAKIRLLDEKIAETDEPDEPPELTTDTQTLIQNLFSFSGMGERDAFEGADALMKFGQYTRTIEEFEKLLARGVQPLMSARNIITCLLLLKLPEMAIERFRDWCEKKILTGPELLHIRDLLSLALVERGIVPDLPFPSSRSPGEQAEDDPPEILTMTVKFEDQELKCRTEELKVTFQYFNILSTIISSSRKELIQLLQPGTTFNGVDFYSSLAFFRGTGKVASRALLKHGQRKGDYLFDISIEGGGEDRA